MVGTAELVSPFADSGKEAQRSQVMHQRSQNLQRVESVFKNLGLLIIFLMPCYFKITYGGSSILQIKTEN